MSTENFNIKRVINSFDASRFGQIKKKNIPLRSSFESGSPISKSKNVRSRGSAVGSSSASW